MRNPLEKSSFLQFMAKSTVPTTVGNKTQQNKEQPFNTAWDFVAHINISLVIFMLKCHIVGYVGDRRFTITHFEMYNIYI
jgi:hypothetical protein